MHRATAAIERKDATGSRKRYVQARENTEKAAFEAPLMVQPTAIKGGTAVYSRGKTREHFVGRLISRL